MSTSTLFCGNANDSSFTASVEYGLILIVQETAIRNPRNFSEMQDNWYLSVVAVTAYFLVHFPALVLNCSIDFIVLLFCILMLFILPSHLVLTLCNWLKRLFAFPSQNCFRRSLAELIAVLLVIWIQRSKNICINKLITIRTSCLNKLNSGTWCYTLDLQAMLISSRISVENGCLA